MLTHTKPELVVAQDLFSHTVLSKLHSHRRTTHTLYSYKTRAGGSSRPLLTHSAHKTLLTQTYDSHTLLTHSTHTTPELVVAQGLFSHTLLTKLYSHRRTTHTLYSYKTRAGGSSRPLLSHSAHKTLLTQTYYSHTLLTNSTHTNPELVVAQGLFTHTLLTKLYSHKCTTHTLYSHTLLIQNQSWW